MIVRLIDVFIIIYFIFILSLNYIDLLIPIIHDVFRFHQKNIIL
jgi:hypothetical protein